jgi:CBS domain-containing protein
MTIARILAAKGRRVFTISPERSLLDALRELERCGVGALVGVGDDGRVVGIISERDIVRALARSGEAALKDTIARHMTAHVKCVLEEDAIETAMEAMTNGRFRHLPVMRRDMLVGIVSIGDVVKHRIDRIEHEHQELRNYIAHA